MLNSIMSNVALLDPTRAQFVEIGKATLYKLLQLRFKLGTHVINSTEELKGLTS